MNQPDTMPFNTQRMGLIRRISVRYGGNKPRELERFIKFLVVGAVGALIDLGLANILINFVFHVQEGQVALVVLCSSISFTAAVISNFIWNRYWTYPDSRSRRIRRQLAQFFAVSIVGLIIRGIIVSLFSNFFSGIVGQLAAQHLLGLENAGRIQFKIGANLAVILALIVVAMWNFFVNRYWTYNDVN